MADQQFQGWRCSCDHEPERHRSGPQSDAPGGCGDDCPCEAEWGDQ